MVASMSITSGRSAETPAVGECSPARAHTRCLTVLRARPRRPRPPRRGRPGSPPDDRPWDRRQQPRRAPCRTAAAKGPTGNSLPRPRTPPDPPYLARVVHRPRPPPRRQGPRELVTQARDPARLGQQTRPGRPHRRPPGLHTHSRTQPAILHREGVLPPGALGSKQPALSQAKQYLHPVFNTPTMKTRG